MDRQEARGVLRSKSRTFYIASRLLPPSSRRDVEILYAYFRWIDDLTDEPGNPHALQQLDEIQCDLEAPVARYPLVRAVQSIATEHGIPRAVLTEIITGARFDLAHSRLTTFDELLRYSDLVAGSVGAALCYILGTPSPQALDSARKLGVAMQITNVLRDVGEDLRRGRIYLPLTDLSRFGYRETDLEREKIDDCFRRLMRLEIDRTRTLYRVAMAGTRYLRPECRPAIHLAAALYSGILWKIERNGLDVFARRASLSAIEKLVIGACCLPGALGGRSKHEEMMADPPPGRLFSYGESVRTDPSA